ncbi:MAG: cobalamin biosynthesis protein [Gammaproteobacteria bacterium]|nr:cobalamin biosynthesis protein [Gammaproteobacteria bacterium]
MLTTALSVIVAVILDWLLGEPRRFHPLVGFGYLAQRLESCLYRSSRWRGVWALALLLLPLTTLTWWVSQQPGIISTFFSIVVLYFSLGHKSLHDHARPIARALQNNNEDAARRLVARMVSRDSSALDITAAATESVLENGNDGVFGALFWFVIAGAPGAMLYRLANTMDAMWGYRNPRYQAFGWAAARFDDVLNLVPARLTAITYALLGKTRQAFFCWRTQAPSWDSPNAGPVMAAGAGALGISIGGPARYLGEWHQRPVLGMGGASTRGDIERALTLVRRGVGLWIVLLLLPGGFSYA